MVFASASSSEVTGIEFDDSEAYRFTMDISSIKEEVLPDSLNMERSFFLIKDGGEPKSGPVSRVKPKKACHNIYTDINMANQVNIRDNTER